MLGVKPFKILLLSRFLSAVAHIAAILLLAIIFLHNPYQFTSVQIAALIGIFALTDRGTAIFWAPFVSVIGYKNCLLLGQFLCFVSLLALTFHPPYILCVLALGLTGLGSSLESLTTRLWISNLPKNEEKITGFSSLYRTLNAGYLIGSAGIFILPVYQQNILVLSGIAWIYLVAFSVTLFLFKTEAATAEEAGGFRIRGHLSAFKPHWRYILFYFGVFLLGIYASCQMHILPFYFEAFSNIPFYLGWALAMNPLLILCFQGQVTRLFYNLQGKSALRAVAIGMFLLGLAFLLFGLIPQPTALWIFIGFLTIGEMLIIPHIDYLLSLRLPSELRPVTFSLHGIAFALGRTASESGGILALNFVHQQGWGVASWWFWNTALFGLVGLLFFYGERVRRQVEKILSFREAPCVNP